MLLVDRHDAPGVAGAGVLRLRCIPLTRRRVVGRVGNRVESPHLRAAACIEGADDAAFHADGAVVADAGAHDHEVAVDRRRGGDHIGAHIADTDALGQVDLAATAEALAGASGVSVQRQQARIERAGEHSPAARNRHVAQFAVLPQAHAARARFRIAACAVDVRVKAPAFLARLRVDGNDDVGGRLQVQCAIGQHRGCLERHLARAGKARATLAGAIQPRKLKVRDVAAVDLLQTRETAAEGVAAVETPVARAARLRACVRREQSARRQCERAGARRARAWAPGWHEFGSWQHYP